MTSEETALINDCEADLREGRTGRVVKRLKAIVPAQLSRKARLPIARIADRAGLTTLGLRILMPIAYPERHALTTPPEPDEIAEYAVQLQRIGSTREALKLLSMIPSLPEASLYRAFCHFSQWEYDSAVPLLRFYLSQDLAPYARLIGRVNLAAALIVCRETSEATEVLEENIAIARDKNYSRLLANCYELRAQTLLLTSEHSQALLSLDEAEKILSSEKTYDRLFVDKWRTLIKAQRSKDLGPLLQFREKAVELSHWETIREIDFFHLQIRLDEDVLDHLVFGTPYSSYRERIERELQTQTTKESYVWGKNAKEIWDLSTGKFTNSTRDLAPGGKIHQLVAILLKDFYRPQRLGGLFSDLFPDERFNILTSPDRVHQILRRARLWFNEEGLPLSIDAKAGRYLLKSDAGFGIQVPFQTQIPGLREIQLRELQRTVPVGALFSTQEATSCLRVSEATFHRLAQHAIDAGSLERVRVGKSTRYRFAA